SCLKLKLRLRSAGYDADFCPYDWRQSIDVLGAQLAQRIRQEDPNGHGRVSIVAHSMGGLVSRAALAAGAPIRRLIMLGTPNFGSFAPVAAWRATNDAVRKAGWLDMGNSAEQLAPEGFNTFPGMTQLLPTSENSADINQYHLGSGAGNRLRPRKDLLDDVAGVRGALAEGVNNA